MTDEGKPFVRRLTYLEAIDISDSHFRTALDAYAHSLYPTTLARTFEQKGKTEALAAKLVGEPEKWKGLLADVEECIALLQKHKLEHKAQSEQARAEKREIGRYEPPDEKELMTLLPPEYVAFVSQKMGPQEAAPSEAEITELMVQNLEAYEPDEPEAPVVPRPGVSEGPAKEAPAKEVPAKEAPAKQAPAKEAPAKEVRAKKAPAKKAPAKEEPAKEEPAKEEPAKEEPVAPPRSAQQRKKLRLEFVAVCVGSILVGAAGGYFAAGLVRVEPPPPVAPLRVPKPLPPVALEAKVMMIVNGKSFAGDQYEAEGKVTVRFEHDKASVTIYVTSVAPPKPAPAPKPAPKPKPRDSFPTGWELQ